jgi:hypothetical protein
LKDGDEVTINLNSQHVFCVGGQNTGQAAQTRPDLKHFFLGRDFGEFHDLAQGVLVHEKILSQPLVWIKVVAAEERFHVQ